MPNSTLRRQGGPLAYGLKELFLLITSLSAAFPVYYMAITSFKSRSEWLTNQFGLPRHPTIVNFLQVFEQGRMVTWLGNTVYVVILSLLASTTVSLLAAYAIFRFHFRGRDFFMNMMIVLMIVPPAVIIVPLFIVMVNIHLVNTLVGVVLIYIGLVLPFSLYLLVSFFRGLPSELFDAAVIDGCTDFDVLWRIVIPLSTPALVTLIVVNALSIWNELLIALVFLQDEQLRTLMPGITLFKGHLTTNEPLIMAASLVAALPMILLYIFGQSFFEEGLIAGALK